MEKAKNCCGTNFSSQISLELGFDDIAREKAREQLDRCPIESALSSEEGELLMFLLYRTILY
jgi:hypothetical protein